MSWKQGSCPGGFTKKYIQFQGSVCAETAHRRRFHHLRDYWMFPEEAQEHQEDCLIKKAFNELGRSGFPTNWRTTTKEDNKVHQVEMWKGVQIVLQTLCDAKKNSVVDNFLITKLLLIKLWKGISRFENPFPRRSDILTVVCKFPSQKASIVWPLPSIEAAKLLSGNGVLKPSCVSFSLTILIRKLCCCHENPK